MQLHKTSLYQYEWHDVNKNWWHLNQTRNFHISIWCKLNLKQNGSKFYLQIHNSQFPCNLYRYLAGNPTELLLSDSVVLVLVLFSPFHSMHYQRQYLSFYKTERNCSFHDIFCRLLYLPNPEKYIFLFTVF